MRILTGIGVRAVAYPRRFSDEQVEQIRRMIDSDGMSFRAVARHFDADDRTVRRAYRGAERERKVPVNNGYYGPSRLEAERSWAEQVKSIPHPKTLNQLLLGDPLPGRSALDRRQREKETT